MKRGVIPAAQQQAGFFIAKTRPLLNIQNILAVMMVLFFAGINVICVLRDFSLTTDEDKHYLYGENILSGDSTRFDDSKMPVTALNGLPKKIGALTGNERIANITSRFYFARMVTILFSCLTALLVFFWARRLYGFIPALFSLSFYVFDPNIIAHSQLVTTDVYVTGMFVLSFYWLWKFANERSVKNGVFCLLALALSQVAKYTAVVLFPLFLVLLLIFDWFLPKESDRGLRKAGMLALNYIKYVVFAAVVMIAVVNIAFLFNRSFVMFGEYNFSSTAFQKIQGGFPILQKIPVPVPYPYLQGLDMMRTTERTGVLSGNVYFLGQVSTLDGFPGYYLVASLLKVPIATQVIFMLALLMYFTRPGRRDQFIQNEMFLLLPVVFFVIYFNFFFNTQIGIRYYLPIYPLLYIFSGSLFAAWDKFSVQQKVASLGLVLYAVVSVLSYHPYYLSYFNEFVWDRKQAYKYLADSNLDWGQAKNELWLHISEHPGAIYAPKKVRAGYIVVGVNDLVGVTDDPQQYAWLRENFEPIDTVAYSYLIYDISTEEINTLCATTTYCHDN